MPAVLLRALLLAPVACSLPLVVTASPETLTPAAAEAAGDPMLSPSKASPDDYRAAIAAIESRNGAYAAALPEQLLSLGLSLQQQNQHEAAIEVFRRGIHLNRINNGLYSPEQVRLLQQEIISLIALEDFAGADERQIYMYRVQLRSPASGLERSRTFIEQAQWQYNAYRLQLGQAYYLRAMSMWDLYRMALNDIIDTEGQTSPKLLEPLEGMLLAQYLITDFNATARRGNSEIGVQQQHANNRFSRYQRESYKQGRAVIQAIYDVRSEVYGPQSKQALNAIVMMGDWTLWHGDSDAALHAYQQAIAELATHGADQDTIDRAFAEPVALPNFDGVHPLPQAVPPGEGAVQLAFTVTANGKVRNLERVDENSLDEARANRLMRKLRRTRFRPQLAVGEPVDTDKVVRAYEIQ